MVALDWAIIAVQAIAVAVFAGLWMRSRASLRRERNYSRQLASSLRDRASMSNLDARIQSLESLSEIAYNALLVVDQSLTVIHMNAAARTLFDVADPPVYGTLIAMTRHHEIDHLAAQALAGIDPDFDWPITVHGTPYRVRAMQITTPGGAVAALAMEDVSELQRLGRARRDMVANVSHELRTPISSIRLLAETLLGGAANDKNRRQDLLGKIAAETDSLQQMAQELLDLSMIESGRMETRLVATPLKDISDAAIGRLSEQAVRKSIKIENSISPELTVLADQEQIVRVLTNLLSNAIKFTPDGGLVTLGAARDGEWASVTVTDTGAGIPEPELERVFERFFKGDRARGRGGTGLGLAIARHIVAAHGGVIHAEKGTNGVGATLVFTLPASE